MPSREFSLRVQDILAEILVVEQTIEGLDFETFSQNQQKLRTVLYSLAVIGEAVASATIELEQADPAIPWHQIRGMRNMVIHEYFRVDVEMIWETVRSDVPGLKESLQRILEQT